MTYLKVAFAMMRLQPLHNGHYNLIAHMIRDNDIVIIGLGSVQESRTVNNPFTAEEREMFINKVFGNNDKIKVVKIEDIGNVSKQEWVNHCMRKIADKGLPQPEYYYGGSEYDLSWYKDTINLNGTKLELINMNRYNAGFMSATEIRKSIYQSLKYPELYTEEWKKYVPKILIGDILNIYAKYIINKVNFD